MIITLAKRLSLRDLTGTETLSAIELAHSRGIQGSRIRDLIQARAAGLAGVQKILTRDSGFSSLGEGIPTEWR